MTDWKTVEVIVSIKVRGEYRAKDLRWDVEQALRRAGFSHSVRTRYPDTGFGRMDVKQRVRVEAAQRVAAAKAGSDA
jgi:hypothetical protein